MECDELLQGRETVAPASDISAEPRDQAAQHGLLAPSLVAPASLQRMPDYIIRASDARLLSEVLFLAAAGPPRCSNILFIRNRWPTSDYLHSQILLKAFLMTYARNKLLAFITAGATGHPFTQICS